MYFISAWSDLYAIYLRRYVDSLLIESKCNNAGGRERPQHCWGSPVSAIHTDGGIGAMARGYAYAKIEYVTYVRIFRKVE